MSTKVAIQKNVKLQEGEELMDFVNKVMDAVATHRQKTERSVFLRGIFKGFIITRDFESGKFFQHKLGRDKDGLIKLGDPVEVRQAFVPVNQAVKGEDGESTVPEEIAKSVIDEESDFVDVVEKNDDGSFKGILGL